MLRSPSSLVALALLVFAVIALASGVHLAHIFSALGVAR